MDLNSAQLSEDETVPAIISPLVSAAKDGRDLVDAVDSIVRLLGFDIFMYGLSMSYHPRHDSLLYAFTTAPREWSARWDQAAYIEVDPRIQRGFESTLPFIWDQTTERGKSVRQDEFLDDASRFGIRSGVSFLLPDSDHASVIMALSSSLPHLDDKKRSDIRNKLGDLFAFGYYFHELFMRQIIRTDTPSRLVGAPISLRERQCLSLAAQGLTTGEIASRLSIKPRTAQFHFDSIRTKLGVLTRQEAVAYAMQERLIDFQA
ncbi:MAG TPA: LuxR family transcriptional regulator [Casimicrobiaceae bacterium]|nr:LuxR family transcriptional regulator [Casimicrobiaceae bacterium]